MAVEMQQKQLSAVSFQLESKFQFVDVSAVKRQGYNGRNEGKMPSLPGNRSLSRRERRSGTGVP